MSGFRHRVGVDVGLDVGQGWGVPEPGADAVPLLIGFGDPAGGYGVEGGVGGGGFFRGGSRHRVFDGVGGLKRDEGETWRGADASDGYFGCVPI